MWTIICGICGVVGIILLIVIALRPKYFWPLLIVVSVGAGGPMINGYGLLDEFFLGCIVLGALLVLSVRATFLKRGQENKWDYLHRKIFYILMVYLALQTLRGILLWGDLRLVRWIIYYAILCLICFFISKKGFPIPNTKRISLIISITTIVYFILYLAHGFFSEIFRHISWLELQGVEWSGPAIAVFPLVIAMPAAIFLFKEKSFYYKFILILLVIISFFVADYYGARTAWLTILMFLIISPTVLGFRRVLPIFIFALISIALIFFLKTGNAVNTARDLGTVLIKSAVLHWGSESGRLQMESAALNAVNENWKTFFFGYGIYSHHLVLSKYLEELGYFGGNVLTFVRVTGIAAFLTDVGWVGMIFLMSNFLFTMRKILFQKRSPGRIILMVVLPVMFLWLIIVNIQDFALYYFLIMPSGLLVQLSSLRQEEQSVQKEKRLMI